MNKALSVLLTVALGVGISGAEERGSKAVCGLWSADAIELRDTTNEGIPEEARDLRIFSNDHAKVVRVLNDRWWVESDGKRLRLAGRKSTVGYPAELAWAHDGLAFYITESDGSIAGFTTSVYQVRSGTVNRLRDLSRSVQRDFRRHHSCIFISGKRNIGDDANVAGLTWTGNPDELLVVAEVPPHSLCEEMGYFGGYLISISSGEILRRYSPQQLMQQWRSVVGERIRGDFSNLSRAQREASP